MTSDYYDEADKGRDFWEFQFVLSMCVCVCVCVRAKLHKTVPALSMIGCRPSTRETFRQ